MKEVNEKLFREGIIGGFDLGSVYAELAGHMLICVTEIRTKEEIDQFAKQLGAIVNE